MSILHEESTISTRGVSLIVNKIYATTILLDDNEDIGEKSWKKIIGEAYNVLIDTENERSIYWRIRKSRVQIPTNGNFLSDEDNGQEVTGYFTEEERFKIIGDTNLSKKSDVKKGLKVR
jgi:hypothetical protein